MTTDNLPAIGTDARMRAELAVMIDELAAKHTRTAIVVPVKEVLACVHRVYANMPRVPDYDPELARLQVWASMIRYVPDEVPEDPYEVRVVATELTADKDPAVRIDVTLPGNVTADIELELAQAEGFFLAGLAAVAYQRARIQ
jgi:hypothetical protein